MLIVDQRLYQVKKIVESLVSKTLMSTTNVLVTADNNLVLFVDNTVMYIIPLKNEVSSPMIGFSYDKFLSIVGDREIDFSTEPIDIYDSYLTENLFALYKGYYDIYSFKGKLVAFNDNLEEDERYSDYLSIKADNGMRYFGLNGIQPGTQVLIPTFTGFPNITSKDKLGIKVYTIDDNFLLVVETIYKKKIARDILMFFRIINLTGVR